jgi:hypothetical protein
MRNKSTKVARQSKQQLMELDICRNRLVDCIAELPYFSLNK